MIWATVSSWSCFCWLYRASSSMAAKNIINLISVLTIWWCSCVESCVVGRGCLLWPVHSLSKTLLAFALLHSVFSVLSFCLFILFMGFSRHWEYLNTEVVCHSLLQWTTFCQTSPPWPARLGWPHRAGLSFVELDKAVVHVIRLTRFLWLWFQCVCPLMSSCNTLPGSSPGWSRVFEGETARRGSGNNCLITL